MSPNFLKSAFNFQSLKTLAKQTKIHSRTVAARLDSMILRELLLPKEKKLEPKLGAFDKNIPSGAEASEMNVFDKSSKFGSTLFSWGSRSSLKYHNQVCRLQFSNVFWFALLES